MILDWTVYCMDGNFGGCILWWNSKQTIIGGINFDGFMMKV